MGVTSLTTRPEGESTLIAAAAAAGRVSGIAAMDVERATGVTEAETMETDAAEGALGGPTTLTLAALTGTAGAALGGAALGGAALRAVALTTLALGAAHKAVGVWWAALAADVDAHDAGAELSSAGHAEETCVDTAAATAADAGELTALAAAGPPIPATLL